MTSNVLAAAALARGFGAEPVHVRDAIRSIDVEARRIDVDMEFVGE